MNLRDKVVLITGSSAGIGLAIAKECLALEAKVMLHGSPNSKEIGTQLAQSLGKNAAFVAGDLRKVETAKKIVGKTIDVFGNLHGLVNNAGLFPRNSILNIDEQSYQDIMDVNLKAPLFLTQQVVRHCINQQIKGSIVNIGSINAYCGQSDILVYSASKGALMTLTRNLADSLAEDGIRINQLNVGWTHTEKEHQTQIKEGRGKNWHQKISKVFAPRGTIMQPEEIARHVGFWLSDYSAPVSGGVYEVEQYPVIGRNKINL